MIPDNPILCNDTCIDGGRVMMQDTPGEKAVTW